MMYKVIKYFVDLQDNNYPYQVGDKFPRRGLKVSADRIAELAGSENKQGVPLIQLVEEAEEKPKRKSTKKTTEE